MARLSGGKAPADILGYLRGLPFPAKKDAVVRTASHNGAPEDVVASLVALPATEYAAAADVIRDYPPLPDEDAVAQNPTHP